jgi:hypothetical protein
MDHGQSESLAKAAHLRGFPQASCRKNGKQVFPHRHLLRHAGMSVAPFRNRLADAEPERC